MTVVEIDSVYLAYPWREGDGMFGCTKCVPSDVPGRTYQERPRSCTRCEGTGWILPNPTILSTFVDHDGNVAEVLSGHFRQFPLFGRVDRFCRPHDPQQGFPVERQETYEPTRRRT